MPSESIPAALRRRVQERANGLCEYCQSPDRVSNASFHCDHILPRTAGGKTELTNLAMGMSMVQYTQTHQNICT